MEEDEIFKETVTVDLTGCKYVKDFWKRIRDTFDFGEQFGENWGAFEDLLTVECPAHKVTVIGANTLPKNWIALDGQHYRAKVRETLLYNKDFKARYNYEFDYEFIDA